MDQFKLESSFKPIDEQVQALERLSQFIDQGKQTQVLLGVTGSGKTFTLANVIARIQRPCLVISHNKTLAAQLYSEFNEFFPHNAVEYFVSYYDYYQPEAYIPQTDVYIEKDASINDRLDRLRLSATSSLLSRRDTLIVSSVSCIYNLGSPEEYQHQLLQLKVGQAIDRDEVLMELINIQYERNDYEFSRGKIRVRGDVIEVYPAYRQDGIRIQFLDDRIESLSQIHAVTGKCQSRLDQVAIYPAKHFIMSQENIDKGIAEIEKELKEQEAKLLKNGKLLEAQRLVSRTRYDMEMLKEVGYCHGIENYSRPLSARPPGARPFCLLDYFPKDFVVFIDESHVTIPQIRGMYEGDRSRKKTLVEHGFRLPSCLDNRPLKFHEFETVIGQRMFVSATPGEYERTQSQGRIVEQIIRPTGIVDPPIMVRQTKGQIKDIEKEISKRVKLKERVLVTTLTKRMAEDLTEYLSGKNLRVKYLHSDIETIDRTRILKELRQKKFDCLIGVNLLREGLDLPEVSLVIILDADKEGFLRSQTSLIQVAGRAARHVNGKVIMYADKITQAMRFMIKECERRRKIQTEFNKRHHITPKSIQKAIREGIENLQDAEEYVDELTGQSEEERAFSGYVSGLEREMELAARNLQFEQAAKIRNRLKELKGEKELMRKSKRRRRK